MFWLVPEAAGWKKWESNSTLKGKKKHLKGKKEEKNGSRGNLTLDVRTSLHASQDLPLNRIALPGQNSNRVELSRAFLSV
jgi:hypothetical protein